MTEIDSILEDFEFLDDWEDRYRYIIELGKTLEPLADDERCEANRVHGCMSQVWVVVSKPHDDVEKLHIRGDSDAMIVKGLIAVVIAALSGQTQQEIINTDIESLFSTIDLREHLSSQRSNGLTALIERIRIAARNL